MLTNLIKASIIGFLILCYAGCHKNNQASPHVSYVRDSAGVKPGTPSFIPASGILVIPSGDIIRVTPQSAGLLKIVSFPSGSYVKKGEILAIIENIEFLKLQQQYLEAKSELFYYREDLKRQGGLAIESATSVKRMQQAQRDFQTSEVRFNSLKKQIALIGFNPDSLDADHLSSDVALRAPVSGYVDQIKIHAGNPVSAGETILVLIRKYDPVIMFELPEEFFTRLKTGNQIEFFFPGDSLVLYKARLTFINRQTDPSSHLIKAWAAPLKTSARLVPGMQVNLRLPL